MKPIVQYGMLPFDSRNGLYPGFGSVSHEYRNIDCLIDSRSLTPKMNFLVLSNGVIEITIYNSLWKLFEQQ